MEAVLLMLLIMDDDFDIGAQYNPKGKAGNALVKACQHGQLQCAEKLMEFGGFQSVFWGPVKAFW